MKTKNSPNLTSEFEEIKAGEELPLNIQPTGKTLD